LPPKFELQAGRLRNFSGLCADETTTGCRRSNSQSNRANLLRRLVCFVQWCRSYFDGGLAMFGWLKSPKLTERAEIAAKQMRYFRLFSQKGSFEGLGASAKRAGFEMIYEDAFGKVAGFRWAADGDSDFTFFVSFGDPEAVLVTADSCGDIFGLVMISISNIPKIIVKAKPFAKHEVGPNAHLFRKIILTFPDFDAESLPSRFEIWRPQG
jgi:hypothetical protein